MALQAVTQSKMTTRRSSSNLMLGTSGINIVQPEHKEIALKQTVKKKNYKLNTEVSPEKKLEDCVSDHLSYELKSGKNLVAKFSTAAFERAKVFVLQNIQLTEFADKYAYAEEYETDQNGAQVEYRLRFFNRKKDGGIGCQQKFVANFYNTKSSLLANGSRVDIFCEEILQPLEEYVRTNCEVLDHINQSISAIIQSTRIKPTQKPPQHADITVGTKQELKALDSCETLSIEPKAPSEANESVERLYFCPLCDKLADQN